MTGQDPHTTRGPLQSTTTLMIVACLIIVLVLTSKHAAPSKTALPFAPHTAVGSIAGSTATTSSGVSTSSPATSTPSIRLKRVTLEASALQAALQPVTPPSVIQARQLDVAGARLLKAVVNIVCISANPSIPSISGSGVIIDPRGIILTAAHVAQVYALQDYLGTKQVQCVVRTGSPARRAYLAEPIYISPQWVASNPDTLSAVSPMGTGENDFALLGITDTATSTPLASSFPSIPLASDDSKRGDPVAIGSYGAEYLTGSQLNYALYPILVFSSIQDRFTFRSGTEDLFSIVGSAASQEGSSGGGIINTSGQLIGEITTSSIDGNLSTRSLNAVTIGHIRRSYASDTGNNLDTTLAGSSVAQLIAQFAAESKRLGNILAKGL